jgi:hypothetical protein
MNFFSSVWMVSLRTPYYRTISIRFHDHKAEEAEDMMGLARVARQAPRKSESDFKVECEEVQAVVLDTGVHCTDQMLPLASLGLQMLAWSK